MSLLEILVQQEVACQEISRAMWKLKQVDILNHGQEKYMFLKNLKIFSQNIWKNHILTNIILKNQKHFDVIFIKLDVNLFCSYSIISSIFKQFGLTTKHGKSDIFTWTSFQYTCILKKSVKYSN